MSNERLEEIYLRKFNQEKTEFHVCGGSKNGKFLHHIVHNPHNGEILEEISFKKFTKISALYDILKSAPILVIPIPGPGFCVAGYTAINLLKRRNRTKKFYELLNEEF